MCEFSEQQLHSSVSVPDSSSSSAHVVGPLRSGPDQASIERRNDEMIDRGTPASEGDEGKKEAEGTREVVEAECERGRPRDDEIMAQHHAIRAEEAEKMSFVGIKEPLSSLAAEYELGNPIFRTKIEKLAETYYAIRRTRGDGNCFFRAFMFSYLEHILETKNKKEASRVMDSVEKCKQTLLDLGHVEFTFEDFLASFTDLLEGVQQGSLSVEKLEEYCQDQSIFDSVVMFFRFITSGEMRKRSDFFEPFILGTSDMTVQQFCRSSVEPMGEESDHVHIIALSDALGVPIRVVHLDGSVGDGGKNVEVNFHDFVPIRPGDEDEKSEPHVILLYRPGHYDVLYRN